MFFCFVCVGLSWACSGFFGVGLVFSVFCFFDADDFGTFCFLIVGVCFCWIVFWLEPIFGLAFLGWIVFWPAVFWWVCFWFLLESLILAQDER